MRRGKWYRRQKWATKNPALPEDWWTKYILAGERAKRLDPASREPFHEWDFEPVAPHPVQCTHFGCGKTLTLRESLFSNFCISHNPANYPS